MTDNQIADSSWTEPSSFDLERASNSLETATAVLGFTYPKISAANLHEFFWLIAYTAHEIGDNALAKAAQKRGLDLQDEKKYP